MAKKDKLVSRTFNVKRVTYLSVNVETQETKISEAKVVRFCRNDKALLDEIQQQLTPPWKAVSISEVETTIERYGMSESKFLEYAEPLPLLRTNTEE